MSSDVVVLIIVLQMTGMGRVADAGCIMFSWHSDSGADNSFDPSKMHIDISISRGLKRLPTAYLDSHMRGIAEQIRNYIAAPHVLNFVQELKNHRHCLANEPDEITRAMISANMKFTPHGENWRRMIIPRLKSLISIVKSYMHV